MPAQSSGTKGFLWWLLCWQGTDALTVELLTSADNDTIVEAVFVGGTGGGSLSATLTARTLSGVPLAVNRLGIGFLADDSNPNEPEGMSVRCLFSVA